MIANPEISLKDILYSCNAQNRSLDIAISLQKNLSSYLYLSGSSNASINISFQSF